MEATGKSKVNLVEKGNRKGVRSKRQWTRAKEKDIKRETISGGEWSSSY